jgi:multidrug resistance efflux pump
MSKLTDCFGNIITAGQPASVELPQPLHSVRGEITSIEEGHVSTLAAPGKQPTVKPTRIVVMVPFTIELDPRTEVAAHIMLGQRPPKAEQPTAEQPAEGAQPAAE